MASCKGYKVCRRIEEEDGGYHYESAMPRGYTRPVVYIPGVPARRIDRRQGPLTVFTERYFAQDFCRNYGLYAPNFVILPCKYYRSKTRHVRAVWIVDGEGKEKKFPLSQLPGGTDLANAVTVEDREVLRSNASGNRNTHTVVPNDCTSPD